LFGEDQSRIIISVKEPEVERLKTICEQHAAPLTIIGEVGGEELIVNEIIRRRVEVLFDVYHHAIRRKVEGQKQESM
jgi:phosphoribosylformylglycinamidine (FGAM) synthase-like enzyme